MNKPDAILAPPPAPAADSEQPPGPAPPPAPVGLIARVLHALRRRILGRSSWDYLKQYTGSDVYWDNAIAAELGWPAGGKKQ